MKTAILTIILVLFCSQAYSQDSLEKNIGLLIMQISNLQDSNMELNLKLESAYSLLAEYKKNGSIDEKELERLSNDPLFKKIYPK